MFEKKAVKKPGDLREVHHEDAPEALHIIAMRNQRILGRCFIASVLLNMVLIVTNVSMFPLKEIVPYIVEFKNADTNVVTIERADQGVRGNAKLLSTLMRGYVSDRESVDKITEKGIRYPRVRHMSTDNVWNAFLSLYGNKDVGPLFKDGLKRYIRFTSDSALAEGIHQVEFQRIDTLDGQQGEAVSKWIATIRYTFVERKVTEAEALMNPTGLVVTEYTIKARQE